MYRSVKQIVDALHAEQTTLKSIRNSVSRYRKLGNLECVIMYMTAVETYLHECREYEEEAYQDRQVLLRQAIGRMIEKPHNTNFYEE